jgi:urease beta subunit
LKPGEYWLDDAAGAIVANESRPTVRMLVKNTGDRPIQVGSHYHFFETNRALSFDRRAAYGLRLNIAAGTAVRFEPGEAKPVTLTEFGGRRRIHGLNGLGGEVGLPGARERAWGAAKKQGFLFEQGKDA